MENKKLPFLNLSPWAILCFLTFALGIVYSNSFHGPFIHDDLPSILHNPSLHSLLKAIQLTSFGAETVTGRPILNFSLALNYAFGGFSPFGYHLTNFFIHLSATFILFSFLRLTFSLPKFSESIRNESIPLAACIAGLWGLHPLQTGSVTLIIQRAESLVSLFYLLTLYCFIRSQAGKKSLLWLSTSIFVCYLGMGTKEIMVSAPLIVLLYDWTFTETDFQRLWNKRRFYYYGLLSSWGLVIYLNLCAKSRDGVYGYAGEITLGQHLQTQSWAIVHYLRLIFWPSPLILDYGVVKVSDWGIILPCTLLLLAIVGTIGWLIWKKPEWGFWGIWAMALVAPTSSIIPMQSEPVSEHRIYLAMVSVLLFLVLGIHHLLGKRGYLLLILLAVVFGFMTYQRNRDYSSEESIWKSTVLHAPLNPRAHNNYAGALFNQSRWEEAEFHLKETIRLEPRHLKAYLNYGRLYEAKGDLRESEGMYRKAIELRPDFSEAKINLSHLFIRQHKISEAENLYREVLQESPRNPLPYLNLGVIYESRKEWQKAETIYLQAIENGVEEPEIFIRLQMIQVPLIE